MIVESFIEADIFSPCFIIIILHNCHLPSLYFTYTKSACGMVLSVVTTRRKWPERCEGMIQSPHQNCSQMYKVSDDIHGIQLLCIGLVGEV